MRLTAISVRRRTATSVLVVAMLVLGLYGLFSLPVSFLPDLQYPMIRINIGWPGATPAEIERNIAHPLERQVATIDNLDYMESSSIEGLYSLTVHLQYGTDLNVGYQDVLAALERARRQLPDDIETPHVFKADPTQLPVLQLVVGSDEMGLVELRDWAEDYLQDELIAIPGVSGTEISGGLRREIRVYLDPLSLAKHDLGIDGILRMLRQENVEMFAGRLTDRDRETTVRTTAEVQDVEELRSIVVARSDGAMVLLGDVADVEDGHEEIRLLTRLGGRDSVRISVYKQAEANTVEVARNVAGRIDQLRGVLPPDVDMRIMENQADYVASEIRGVRDAAIGAAFLVILVVYLFLGDVRLVAVMLVALVSTLVLNFAFMHLAGFSLNVFSLGGLVIAMGVVVDHSIVVVENITRTDHAALPDQQMDQMVVMRTGEVGPALVAATVSLLALLAPIYMVPAVAALLFRELVAVIAGIVIISLGVAVLITPMLTAWLMGRSGRDNRSRGKGFQRLFGRLTGAYGRLLQGMMKARWLVVGSFLALLPLAVWMLPRLGTEFLPAMDDGRLSVMVNLPIGTAVEQTDRVVRQVEDIVEGMPHVESSFAMSGGRIRGMRTQEESHIGVVDIQLVRAGARDVTTAQFMDALREATRAVFVPGGRVMVRPSRIRGMRQRGEGALDVQLRGRDAATLADLAVQAQGILRDVRGLENVTISQDESKPEYHVRIDRMRAGDRGLSAHDVASSLQTLMRGTVATRFRQRDRYYDVRVMMPENAIASTRDLEQVVLRTPDGGGYVPLLDVTGPVETGYGAVEIVRENQVQQVVISADIADSTLGQVLQEVRTAMEAMDPPPGYEISYGGQAQELQETTRALTAIFAFALFFAFVVLAVQFNSLRLPAIVLGNVPFSLVGMVFILWLTGIPAGATVIIGMLVVLAATISDGVLLTTYAENLRREGRDAVEAAIEAATVRLRPRVMTTLTTMAGFAVLALKISEGGDLLQPMAIAAIGGLAMEMMVALFLLPCGYAVVTRKAAKSACPPALAL